MRKNPQQHQTGYLIEESGDELNDETFGDLNDESIGRPDFDFAAQTLPESKVLPSPSPPPMAARRGLTAAELEQQVLSQRQPPAQLQQQQQQQQQRPMAIPKRNVVMNLSELENSFKASVSISSQPASLPPSSFPSSIPGSFPNPYNRPMSPPPGFVSGPPRLSQLAAKPIPQITFPDLNDGDEGEISADSNRFLMTKYEREGIRHIHMAQLTTENPILEDFYYQAFSKRSLKNQNQNQSNTPLYLPLPTNFKKRQHASAKDAKDRPNNLEGALGKFSSSSSRKPRQQLQVDLTTAHQTMKIDSNEISSEELFFSVLGTVEKIFASIFKLEDFLEQTDDTEYDVQVVGQAKQEARCNVVKALHLEDERPWGRVEILRFINILSLPKGRKAIFRSIRLLDSSFSKAFLSKLVECLEYLNVFRPNTSVGEIESFVNLVLSPLVPFVSEAPADFIVECITAFHSKPSFLWLFYSRPGVILMCILMSRLEIVKSSFGGDVESDPLLGSQWPQLARTLFDSISERLLDFFNVPSLKLPHAKGAFDGGDYYIWQLMALIALNVDAEAKKLMIVELRDKIMAVVQYGSPKDLTNLNIFLNVLGLDSNQLSS